SQLLKLIFNTISIVIDYVHPADCLYWLFQFELRSSCAGDSLNLRIRYIAPRPRLQPLTATAVKAPVHSRPALSSCRRKCSNASASRLPTTTAKAEVSSASSRYSSCRL